jgi:hypothetical protein
LYSLRSLHVQVSIRGDREDRDLPEQGNGSINSSTTLALDSRLVLVDAPKFVATTSGKPPGPELSAAPFPFGIVAPTGDNGTSFPKIISKRDGWMI